MKKILFPTAYAAHSAVAFRYAQKLAQYFESSITLVHVYQKASLALTSTGGLVSEDIKTFEERQWSREMEKLTAFAKEFQEVGGEDIQLDFIVTDGSVLEQLLHIQQVNHFDMIVMGTRRHRLVDRFFGNTTYRLIDEVTCPLLLIPPDTQLMSIDKILYGTAFKIGDNNTIEILLDWCLAFGSSLNLLHIHKKENAYEAAFNMEALMDRFTSEKAAGIIKAQMREGNIQEVLRQYIKDNGVNLLAVHRRKQGLLQEMTDGSLTKLLSEEIQIPLLILKF